MYSLNPSLRQITIWSPPSLDIVFNFQQIRFSMEGCLGRPAWQQWLVLTGERLLRTQLPVTSFNKQNIFGKGQTKICTMPVNIFTRAWILLPCYEICWRYVTYRMYWRFATQVHSIVEGGCGEGTSVSIGRTHCKAVSKNCWAGETIWVITVLGDNRCCQVLSFCLSSGWQLWKEAQLGKDRHCVGEVG